jgi:hypothetical protein
MILSELKIKRGIDLFDNNSDKDLVQKAEAFAASEPAAGTVLSMQILQLTSNQKEYLNGNWKNIISQLKSLFKKQKIEVLGRETNWLPVSIYHAYCPDVEGAKVKIECTGENTTEGETSVEILGIGGGPSFNLEFASALEVEADNKSFSLVYEFESVWEHIRLTQPDGHSIEFCKLAEINKNTRKVHTDLLQAPVYDPASDIEETEEITLGEGIIGTKKLSIKSGSILKVSKKLKLEKIGLEAGTEITTANQFELAYEYSLPGGRTYIASHPRNAAYWLWAFK